MLLILVVMAVLGTRTTGEQRVHSPVVLQDTVRGIVYDSLAQAPIAGAIVRGAGGQAVTDSLGRFELVASERVARVVAYHESLEAVGITALSAERSEASTPWHVVLSTPGIETVWSRVCIGRRPQGGRGGIVFGSVRRAVGADPVEGAILELQWENIQALQRPGDTSAVYAASTTASDRDGLFAFCGVQEFGQAGIVARAGLLQSANILIPADARPVRRIDLTVAEQDARGIVRGVVVDGESRPVVDATVFVDGVESPVLSDSAGRFLVTNVPLGSRMMISRKLGHLPAYRAIDVRKGEADDVILSLERGVTLEGVKVLARANLSLYRREFEERRASGFAQLMDSTELRKYASLQTALRRYPMLYVQTANNGTDFALFGRITKGTARCRVYVWVDGMLSDEETLRILPKEEVAATELFTSDAFAPARFRTFGDTCAVLLVWTRNFLR